MSAVPGNILDFGSWSDPVTTPYWVSGGYTQSTDYSSAPLSDGVPETFTNPPRSDGITWGGALDSAMKTAADITATFGKVYQLNAQLEGQQFQRKLSEGQLDIQRTQALGSLEVQKATLDANTKLELARAQRATPDALAAVKAGGAGFLGSVSKLSPLLIISAGAVAYLLFTRGKK